MKRAFDVAACALFLVVFSPVLLLIIVAIRLQSPGNAIFAQIRVGRHGRPFTCYKFRTMHAGTANLPTHQVQASAVTALGESLRRLKIDEIPQLWNVLIGDMSLVGPRPPVPEEVEQYKGWQRRRLRMRPGLTCLWAVNGRDHLDFETWMRLDMQYIDNWSLGLDWKIILRTIPQVLSGRGAH